MGAYLFSQTGLGARITIIELSAIDNQIHVDGSITQHATGAGSPINTLV